MHIIVCIVDFRHQILIIFELVVGGISGLFCMNICGMGDLFCFDCVEMICLFVLFYGTKCSANFVLKFATLV